MRHAHAVRRLGSACSGFQDSESAVDRCLFALISHTSRMKAAICSCLVNNLLTDCPASSDSHTSLLHIIYASHDDARPCSAFPTTFLSASAISHCFRSAIPNAFTGQDISHAMPCAAHTVVMMVCTLASKAGEMIGCTDTQVP